MPAEIRDGAGTWPDGITLRRLTPDDLDESFDLASRVFARSSTLHRALGIQLDTYRAYLRPAFADMVRQGLSLVAQDHQTKRIVGCLIATALPTDPPMLPDPSDTFAPLAALTSELVTRYRNQRQVRQDEAMLVDMGAVTKDATGRGIYRAMRRHADHIARANGFRFVLGELSSAATRHVVLNQMGHRAMAEVPFATFEFHGTYPFRSIKEPPSLILSEGDLG